LIVHLAPLCSLKDSGPYCLCYNYIHDSDKLQLQLSPGTFMMLGALKNSVPHNTP